MDRNAQLLAKVDALEVKEKLFLAPTDKAEKAEATEKRLEARRRWRLEQIGCLPDNHPKTHTAEEHLQIKTQMYADHQERIRLVDESSRAEATKRMQKDFDSWKTQSDKIVENFHYQQALAKVKADDLKQAISSRSFNYEVCDKPTRKGWYLNFKVKGLSPGFTWFIGSDENGNYIEEWLG